MRSQWLVWMLCALLVQPVLVPAAVGTIPNPGAGAGPKSWSGDLSPIGKADWSYARAGYLLERAGFGGTPEEIARLAAMTPQQAVDYLVNYESIANVLPAFEESGIFKGFEAERDEHMSFDQAKEKGFRTGELYGAKALDKSQPRRLQPILTVVHYARHSAGLEWNRAAIWLANRMVQTRRPLEEKMTLFWHGHFATEDFKVRDYRIMLDQFGMLRNHATGNFRDLLLGISKDPAMLIYLDGKDNVKGKPNENYAREVLELFGLGVGNYTEQDIKESARALTGWYAYGREARFRPEMHDEGLKTVLGKTGNLNEKTVVEAILARPQAAEFISRKLYKFFVRADMSAAMNKDLAQTLRSNQYQIKPLLKRMFLSKDFYSAGSYGTQIKSPVQFMVSTYKKLGLTEVPGLPFFPQVSNSLGQSIGDPPNVAGWPGDKDGGRSWLNPSTLLERGNITGHLLFPETAKGKYWQKGPYRGNGGGNAVAAADDTMPAPAGNKVAAKPAPYAMEMSPAMKSLYANEAFNPAIAIRDAYARMNKTVKDVPLTPAKFDLAAMLQSAGVKTSGEAVDYLAVRFLRLSPGKTDRDAMVAFLERKNGGTQIDFANAQAERRLREVLHLVMSTPEYQLF